MTNSESQDSQIQAQPQPQQNRDPFADPTNAFDLVKVDMSHLNSIHNCIMQNREFYSDKYDDPNLIVEKQLIAVRGGYGSGKKTACFDYIRSLLMKTHNADTQLDSCCIVSFNNIFTPDVDNAFKKDGIKFYNYEQNDSLVIQSDSKIFVSPDNISSLLTPNGHIWTPDIVMINDIEIVIKILANGRSSNEGNLSFRMLLNFIISSRVLICVDRNLTCEALNYVCNTRRKYHNLMKINKNTLDSESESVSEITEITEEDSADSAINTIPTNESSDNITDNTTEDTNDEGKEDPQEMSNYDNPTSDPLFSSECILIHNTVKCEKPKYIILDNKDQVVKKMLRHINDNKALIICVENDAAIKDITSIIFKKTKVKNLKSKILILDSNSVNTKEKLRFVHDADNIWGNYRIVVLCSAIAPYAIFRKLHFDFTYGFYGEHASISQVNDLWVARKNASKSIILYIKQAPKEIVTETETETTDE